MNRRPNKQILVSIIDPYRLLVLCKVVLIGRLPKNNCLSDNYFKMVTFHSTVVDCVPNCLKGFRNILLQR